ncbi:hypothetical protein [Micromonospora endophytica]|uniref:Uncharacterized protein n=1 Tax=Micromonospora endophytica TaxID=515350 RepID=A0A2W2D5T9_9ACTN|nr:hypothetical protein [Micromonospora endophytica]PZG00915.1 hypothetical protein C1I93_01190 [Micromonospora endophytica]RIW46254.1 hypothetical protein D3H59_13175 [Micromonospora endophytica]BCJ61772.1 hypothetical protein Jiend_51940 [Micromonospora endophytica]
MPEVTVHLFGELLAEALSTPDGREFALARTVNAEHLGAGLPARSAPCSTTPSRPNWPIISSAG